MLGFLVSSAIGSAIAAVGAAISINLIYPTASPLHVWRLWFAACSLGVVTVAPLLIWLADVKRERLSRRELVEGWAGVITLAALTAFLISLPEGPKTRPCRGRRISFPAMGCHPLPAGVGSRSPAFIMG